MAELLVTGGAGFVGANFVNYWKATHPDDTIRVLDKLTYAADPRNIAGLDGVSLVVGDICDVDLVSSLLADHAIDTIVHFAAESHVDRSIVEPGTFITTNVLGTHALLEAAKRTWLDVGSGRPHRFHHVSTDEVYGSLAPRAPACDESAPYAPNSPYAASKAASDHLVRAYGQTYGLAVTTTHSSNNYGRFQFPEKLVPLCIRNALSGQPIPLYGDGLNRRDWLHVEDHCRGIEACLLHGAPGEAYNIGGGREMTNRALVDIICEALDTAFALAPALATRFPDAPPARGEKAGSLITYVADRAGHDRRYAMNCGKARHALGYDPQQPFESGLADTLEWFLTQSPTG